MSTHSSGQVSSGDGYRIVDVKAHPVNMEVPKNYTTSWKTYTVVSMVLVEIRTENGAYGIGECLARFAPIAYAEVIEQLLRPILIGKEIENISGLWEEMSRVHSGRQGGMLIEAIAGVDIALWDLLGKKCNQPISVLLGGKAGVSLLAYGSTVPWAEEKVALGVLERFLEKGLSHVKVKTGEDIKESIAYVTLMRERAGEDIELSVDANWAYDRAGALVVGRALEGLNYLWFEEPIKPEDEKGYRILAEKLDVPLAAGESNYTSRQALGTLQIGALSYLQPDVARSGGISETFLTAQLARVHEVKYAPHVGMSGIICELASEHLAAASPNFATMECSERADGFMRNMLDVPPAIDRLNHGCLISLTGPGLGVEVDWDAVRAAHPER